jgi:hypothetical protein
MAPTSNPVSPSKLRTFLTCLVVASMFYLYFLVLPYTW